MAQGNRVELTNPDILRWAREELGLTLHDVAAHVHKTPEIVASWETGDDHPTFRQLTDLANYYKRPIAAFFLPATPPHSEKPDDFRTLPGVISGVFRRETLLAYREMTNMLNDTRELLDALSLGTTLSLPRWTTDDDVEAKAAEVRTFLGISLEKQTTEFTTHLIAQDAWRSVLFDRGVVVRICRMPINDARAFCLTGNGLAGIGLSNEDREHGRIFSLFHEICHLGLQRPGVSGIQSRIRSANQAIEQYCDHFSASFLLPRSHPEVFDNLSRFSESPDIETARHLANRFKVSKYVVLRRALDLGLIREAAYWQAMDDFRKYDSHLPRGKDGGGNYHATQVSRLGRRFVNLVMQAFNNDYISPAEARRVLGMDPLTV